MLGLGAQTGWLAATPGPKFSENGPGDDSRSPPAPRPVQGGPRLAQVVLAGVLCGYIAVQLIDVISAPLPAHRTAIVVSVVADFTLFALTLSIASARTQQCSPRGQYAVLAGIGLVTYLPLAVLHIEWGGMAGFLAGSVLLALPGWWGWVMFAAVDGSMLLAAVLYGLSAGETAYLTASTMDVGLAIFGLARLAQVIRYVHNTRGELAQLAIVNERMRFARDLHDLLGYSLSAITLKAELTRRLVASNQEGARYELGELLDIARQALADVRTVARGYRNISLAKEANSVTSLLAEAGIDARVDVACQALDETVDTVLATVLRETVTNLLRHSAARRCVIEASISEDTVRLTVANDGVPRSAANGRRGGGLENLTERLAAIGGRLTAEVRDDGWFNVLAEAPASIPAAAHPAAVCREGDDDQ
jgi:two-component system, NarL family, sensor histidine kinase DesK